MPCHVVMRPVGILLIVEDYEKLNFKSLCVEFLVIQENQLPVSTEV